MRLKNCKTKLKHPNILMSASIGHLRFTLAGLSSATAIFLSAGISLSQWLDLEMHKIQLESGENDQNTPETTW